MGSNSSNSSQSKQLLKEPEGMTLLWGSRVGLSFPPLLASSGYAREKAGLGWRSHYSSKNLSFQDRTRAHLSSRWMEPVVTADMGSWIGETGQEHSRCHVGSRRSDNHRMWGEPGTWDPAKPHQGSSFTFLFLIFTLQAHILWGKNQGSKWTWFWCLIKSSSRQQAHEKMFNAAYH